MIGQYKTFTDYLMDQGVHFHQDTVVLHTNVADWGSYSSITGVGIEDIRVDPDEVFNYTFDGVLMPPFEHFVVEWFQRGDPDPDAFNPDDGGAFYYDKGHLKLFKYNPESMRRWMVSDHKYLIVEVGLKLSFQLHENNDYTTVTGKLFDSLPETLTAYTNDLPYPVMNDSLWLFFATVFMCCNNSNDIELMTPLRGDRRRAQKAGIKEPSPYFLLKVDPTKPRKVYESTGNHTGQKNRAHIVRGHFRHVHDHPLAQFNGTFWIPAHMRGDKDKGIVNKGYRIVLPEKTEKEMESKQ